MIPGSVIAYFIVLAILGIVGPIGIVAFYIKKTREKVSTVLVGALIFAFFALGLETIPKLFLFQIPSPVSRFLMGNAWGLSIVGALLAGIFEETGRYVGFSFLLKNRTKKTTAIAYGLGHGLFEVMFLWVYGAFQNMVYIIMINTGYFDTVLEQVAEQAPDQLETLKALPEAFRSVSFATLPVAIIERVGAVFFHVGASILVFYAVRAVSKKWAYFCAILLHMALDIFAGLGQTGVIESVYVLEAIVVAFGMAMFLFCYVNIYQKMPTDTAAEPEEVINVLKPEKVVEEAAEENLEEMQEETTEEKSEEETEK